MKKLLLIIAILPFIGFFACQMPSAGKSKKVVVNQVYTITFMASATAYRESSMVYLDSVAAFMKRNPESRVRLDGYPDRDQKIDPNMTVTSHWLKKSEQRLFSRGVAISRIDTRINNFKRTGFLGDINIDVLVYFP
jgi:hypothetical protein